MNEKPRVKICGITRLEDALLAQELGAWAVGFVFYPKSPRWISPKEAGAMVRHLSPALEKIGVFVDPTLEEVRRIQGESGITKVQLHGRESPDFCREIGQGGVIKALRPGEKDMAPLFSDLFAFLVDAEKTRDGSWGGTGIRSDWPFAVSLKSRFPVILAGGISAANVRESLGTVDPFALDVSSSIETVPGVKDPRKMREFFAAIQQPAGGP